MLYFFSVIHHCIYYQHSFWVAKSCSNLCDSMDCSMPDFPVLHHLPKFAQTYAHWVDDAIQPFHPLSPTLYHMLKNIWWIFVKLINSPMLSVFSCKWWTHRTGSPIVEMISTRLYEYPEESVFPPNSSSRDVIECGLHRWL